MDKDSTHEIDDLVPLEDEADVRPGPERVPPRRAGRLALPAILVVVALVVAGLATTRGTDPVAPPVVVGEPTIPTAADAARFAEQAALSLGRGNVSVATPALAQRVRLRAVPDPARIYALSRKVVSFNQKTARVEIHELGVVGHDAIFATARLDLRWTGSRYVVTELVTRPGPIPGGALQRRKP